MNFINRIIEYEQAFHAVMENLIIEGSFMSLAIVGSTFAVSKRRYPGDDSWIFKWILYRNL